VAAAGFLLAVLGVYFAFFWSKGQTLAMKTWRIAIVDRHGRPADARPRPAALCLCWIWVLPPLAALASRTFTLPQLGVIFGWVVFWALLSRLHPQRQFWHDAFAGTRLVDAPPSAAAAGLGDNRAMTRREALPRGQSAETAHRPQPGLARRRLFAGRPARRLGRAAFRQEACPPSCCCRWRSGSGAAGSRWRCWPARCCW
jgi:hypothetical protein